MARRWRTTPMAFRWRSQILAAAQRKLSNGFPNSSIVHCLPLLRQVRFFNRKAGSHATTNGSPVARYSLPQRRNRILQVTRLKKRFRVGCAAFAGSGRPADSQLPLVANRPRDGSPQRTALLLNPVALLVFFPAAARAGVVAAHLFARPALRGLVRRSRASHAGSSQFPLLLALKLLLKRVDGR